MRRRASRLAGFIIRDQRIEDAYKNKGKKKQEAKQNERETNRQSNSI